MCSITLLIALILWSWVQSSPGPKYSGLMTNSVIFRLYIVIHGVDSNHLHIVARADLSLHIPIAWLVAWIRRAVRIHRTQKVYQCTIFHLRKMYDKLTKFVLRHRKDFVPLKTSSLCSIHFEESCFEERSAVFQGRVQICWDLKDSLFQGSIPTRDTVVPYSSPESSWKWRKVSALLYSFTVLDQSSSISLFDKYIDYNELFVSKTCHFNASVCKMAQIIDKSISFMTFLAVWEGHFFAGQFGALHCINILAFVNILQRPQYENLHAAYGVNLHQ